MGPPPGEVRAALGAVLNKKYKKLPGGSGVSPGSVPLSTMSATPGSLG